MVMSNIKLKIFSVFFLHINQSNILRLYREHIAQCEQLIKQYSLSQNPYQIELHHSYKRVC